MMANYPDTHDRACVIAALLGIGFAAALRRSELVRASTVEDITFVDDGLKAVDPAQQDRPDRRRRRGRRDPWRAVCVRRRRVAGVDRGPAASSTGPVFRPVKLGGKIA